MEQRLTIITLGVSDLQKATDFYELKFGWKKSEVSNQYISFFNLNGIQLALYPNEALAQDAKINSKGSGFKSFTLAYNTRTKTEVDELTEALRTKGVTICKEPQTTNWGGYHSYITDPDGNLWEIAYNPYLIPD